MKDIKNIYSSLPQQHRIVIAGLSVLAVLLLIFPSDKATASKQTEGALEIGKRYQLAVPQSNDVQAVSTQASTSKRIAPHLANTPPQKNQKQASITSENVEAITLNWTKSKIKKGDSLGKIFKRNGLSAKTTHLVSKSKGEFSTLLKKLKVGDVLHIGKNNKGELVQLKYPLSRIETLLVTNEDGKYVSHKETKDVEIREAIAHGVVQGNFWNAGIEAGLTANQIISLANLFGWDIDFALDIRKGDSFHVVYEDKYVDGEFIGTGKILAAEFINQDDPFQAIRFSDGDYYSPDGKSMKKAFLRAPVSFKYISSNFKPKRFHPIQKRWKAHNGTDYRAKKGTPVVASGNGKVTHSTYNKYNGNYVFIQHGNGIVTKYLHFSKRAVKKGQRVKQGQVIGYVGSTGMSQAPHLHYEFLLNGVHRNPRTVKLPDAKPIAKKYKQEFASLAKQRLNELSGSKQALLAKVGSSSTRVR